MSTWVWRSSHTLILARQPGSTESRAPLPSISIESVPTRFIRLPDGESHVLAARDLQLLRR